MALRTTRAAIRFDDSWPEPWVALGALLTAGGKDGAALEALMGANARDPNSRVVAMMVGMALDELELCDESYLWLVRAAHAAWEDPSITRDGHSNGEFWKELGRYCYYHDRKEEMIEVAALAVVMD